jgi:hypothetical protein
VGRNCRFLQGQEKDQEELQKIRDAIKNAKPVEVTLRNFRKNGELFFYFLRVQYDVTEQILAQQEIKTLTDTINTLQNQ